MDRLIAAAESSRHLLARCARPLKTCDANSEPHADVFAVASSP